MSQSAQVSSPLFFPLEFGRDEALMQGVFPSSFAPQWAPFSPSYSILNATSDLVWFNSSARGTHRNACSSSFHLFTLW